MIHCIKYLKLLALLWFVVLSVFLLNLLVYASEKEDSQVTRKADTYINEGPEFLGSTIKTSKSVIIKHLGKPNSIKSEKVRNNNDDSIDTIYGLSYEGLFVKVYEVSSDNRGFIIHIILDNNKYKTKWGLNIGSTRNAIVKVLGEPDENTDTSCTFMFSEAYPKDTVIFYFKHNLVEKIEWRYTVN